jgi:YD repeat-containing protein
VTAAAGRTLTFNYANSTFPRLCTSIADSVGTVATYDYDSSGRLTQVQYAGGSESNFSYDSNDLILSVTDPLRKTIEAQTYDSQQRGLTSQRAKDSSGNPVEQVTVEYAPWSRGSGDHDPGPASLLGGSPPLRPVRFLSRAALAAE